MDNLRVDGPAGPPKPVNRHDAAAWCSAIGVALASAGLLLLVSCPIRTRTMGASLSTRLQWEQRRQEAAAAARAADQPEFAAPDTPDAPR